MRLAHLPATPTLEQLFVETYGRLNKRLVDYARRFVSPDDALDAVGDAWLSIWRRWPSLPHEKRNDRYFFGAVHKRVVTTLRRNRALVSIDDAEAELDGHVMDAFRHETCGDTIADALDVALLALPPRRREVLLLTKGEDLSYLEAAESLGLSIGTIKTHARLAKADLRVAFTRAGYPIAGSPRRQRTLPSMAA